jgi:RNA polymerase sigma factor (sigma-70 family)
MDRNLNVDLLLELYRDKYIHAMVMDFVAPDDVDDVVQEVVLRAYDALLHSKKKYAEVRMLRPWLRIVVRNFCINYLNRVKHPHSMIVSLEAMEESGLYLESGFGDPLSILIVDEVSHELDRIFSRLPALKRRILILHFLYDMSYAEIAGMLECSSSTVRSQAHRGLMVISRRGYHAFITDKRHLQEVKRTGRHVHDLSAFDRRDLFN